MNSCDNINRQSAAIQPTSEGANIRLIGFLSIPGLFVLVSVFMTVLSFMMSKVEEGETWETLMGWWWSLIAVSPYYTIGVPLIVCTGITILLLSKSWK